MIKTFSDKRAAVFSGLYIKGLSPDIAVRARKKLIQIHRAVRVEDLRLPPSNHLEKLLGNREGRWSIRINDQWRVCFCFVDGDAFDVEMVDYH
ncbi:MAG: type II toxin-antitoxin system RelE/ParE family toxin [Magnetococcales bacterium]|nr:type II toxin-antitoxin system RelE/ParE family toxin [Magnetococcales bacterium]NGZ25331.1 type II toxin-antitoxin system RelE/ParE family toxin [Magnetococcales bacterium]